MTFEGNLRGHAIFVYTERVGAMESCNGQQSDNGHPYWRFRQHQETLNKQGSQKFSKREF